MIVVNALAEILPINGLTTGQVSNSYPNLFAPAAFTFAIWGLIYLLLASYTLYQLGIIREDSWTADRRLLKKISVIFSLSSLANTAWIFSWHNKLIPLTMILMIVILVCLIKVNQITVGARLIGREYFFIRLPFSIYFGWITVATIANATVLLVSLGWNVAVVMIFIPLLPFFFSIKASHRSFLTCSDYFYSFLNAETLLPVPVIFQTN